MVELDALVAAGGAAEAGRGLQAEDCEAAELAGFSILTSRRMSTGALRSPCVLHLADFQPLDVLIDLLHGEHLHQRGAEVVLVLQQV